eukprot:193525_1
MSSFATLNVKEPESIDYAKQYLSPWSGYFKKSIQERQQSVQNESNEAGSLPLNIADIMIENCIGTLSLPLGISPNFVINNKHFIVPFCVEEPSVIAAASSISKLIAKNGGFSTSNSNKNIMIGQVQILNIHKDINKAINIIKQNESKYIKTGNNKYCASMVKRGGGIHKIETRIITPRIYKHNKTQRNKYLVIHIHVDVCDAMGANKVNTVCEGLSTLFQNDLISNGFISASIGLKILSNLCTERMTISTFCIPISNLSWKGIDGMIVATKMVEAYEFAIDDVYRATTNNKGIMNGMDAVAIALGQDWRAIEASSHCYAYVGNDNIYGPLAHYFIEYSIKKQCECLYGYLNIPISVGTKGGSITTHPGYKYTVKQLLPSQISDTMELKAKHIADIIVSAGLANNFAAIRALAIEGIQKGHMMLHSKNIAVSVLNENEHNLVNEVSQFMVKKKAINTNMGSRYIKARNIEFEQDFMEIDKKENECFPSTLMVEIPSKYGMIVLDIVIDTYEIKNKEILHLEIKRNEKDFILLNMSDEQKIDEQQLKNKLKMKDSKGNNDRMYFEDMILKLFGKTIDDIVKTYNVIDSFNVCSKSLELQENNDECKFIISEIKLLSLLINILLSEYVVKYKDENMKNSFIKLICDELKNYIIKQYCNGDESNFKKNENYFSTIEVKNICNEKQTKMKQTEEELELKLFSECLIKSLIRALVFRVKSVEMNIAKSFTHCLLNWQLLSLYSLQCVYGLNAQFVTLNVSETQESVGKCLYDVLLQKANKYPALIFLASNIVGLHTLNENVIGMIEQYGL